MGFKGRSNELMSFKYYNSSTIYVKVNHLSNEFSSSESLFKKTTLVRISEE